MSEQQDIEISGADVEALAAKLQTLMDGLNEREQAILSHVLQTAADGANEVSGFAAVGFSPGIAFDLAAVVNVRDVAGKVQMQDFHFVKKVDKSSAKLF